MRGLAALVRTVAAAFAACAGLALIALAGFGIAQPASFQRVQVPAPKPEVMENCPGLVAGDAPRLTPAGLRLALNADQVRLTYVGHATFLIESPQLVRIATDYNDYVRPPVLPDIVTMNHAHDTHYTERPDPAIKYVLRGWGPSPTAPASWDLKYRHWRERNLPP